MISSPSTSSAGRLRFVPLAAAREWPAWRKEFAGRLRDHRFHELVADTLGFDCRALVLVNGEGEAGAVLPCFFVEQDLLAAAPTIFRQLAAAVRRAFPRFLRLRMLMAGCPAGDNQLGAGLSGQPDRLVEMHRALCHAARAHGARLVVWKDVSPRDRGLFAVLKNECAPLASMPATRLALDFASFEEFLSRRSHATRKSLRRKFKALASAPPLTFSVTNELADAADETLALYEQVRARSSLQFERLTKSFLVELAARMPERVRFFLWRQEGRLVAFSLCLVHDGALYDEYLGLDYRVALDLHLYFVTFRDVLTWALAQGLTAYHSTPLGYAPKHQLGFTLAPLDLYCALPWPRWNQVLMPLLRRMSPARRERSLADFPNARELPP